MVGIHVHQPLLKLGFPNQFPSPHESYTPLFSQPEPDFRGIGPGSDHVPIKKGPGPERQVYEKGTSCIFVCAEKSVQS